MSAFQLVSRLSSSAGRTRSSRALRSRSVIRSRTSTSGRGPRSCSTFKPWLRMVRVLKVALGGHPKPRDRRVGILPEHTADAQGLYEKLGFVDAALAYPVMERPRRYDSRP
jgi:hypothetical protein